MILSTCFIGAKGEVEFERRRQSPLYPPTPLRTFAARAERHSDQITIDVEHFAEPRT